MIKLFLLTALMRLPYALLIILPCFVIAQWALQWEGRVLRVIARSAILLCTILATAGIIYASFEASKLYS